MTTKADYQENIRKYKAIEEQLGKITPKLSSASPLVGNVSREIETTYKVDGDGAKIASRADKLRKTINTTYSNITKIVLPALGTAIQGAKIEVQKIEAAEEEAARLAAEAAAATEAEQTTTLPTDPSQVHPSTDPNKLRYKRGAQE
ncbi:hypothetical protein J5491_01265 [Candidatus Saccharibacteria bacterium]|nr:hypothetical protein [Candidatus Saccharibacteria bacterium]